MFGLKSCLLLLIVCSVSINGQTNTFTLTATMMPGTPAADTSFPYANMIDAGTTSTTSCAATVAATSISIDLGSSININQIAIITASTTTFTGTTVTLADMNGSTAPATAVYIGATSGALTTPCTTIAPGTAAAPFDNAAYTGKFSCGNAAGTFLTITRSGTAKGIVICDLKVYLTDPTVAPTTVATTVAPTTVATTGTTTGTTTVATTKSIITSIPMNTTKSAVNCGYDGRVMSFMVFCVLKWLSCRNY